VLAAVYSAAVPLFEISDEVWHYPMVLTLAQGHGLPEQDPADPGPWRQEGSQPPLYYGVGVLATVWFDTSNIDDVRRLNPHVDTGVITPDGNVNLVVHNQQAEAWPWHRAALAVHVMRLLSALMGAGTIYLTYRIGREVFPERRWLALGGAALAAFTPMFVFISASVNNDNLAVLLSTAMVLMLVRIVRLADDGEPTQRMTRMLGVVLAFAALTKESTLGLFGLAVLVMVYAAWRQRRWGALLLDVPLTLVIAFAIAGQWYLRNWDLYGDPLGLNTFLAMVGARPQAATLAQLWGERTGFIYSYWGLFGGVNVPMAGWVYAMLNALAALAAIGAIVFLVRRIRQEGLAWTWLAPALVTLLWIPGVGVPLIRWTLMTPASQGRLMFPAIASLSLWMAVGLGGLLPERIGRIAVGGAAGFMLALSIAAPFVWIRPAYRPPAQIAGPVSASLAEFQPPGEDTPAMRLLAAEVSPDAVTPGENVRVTLTWEVAAPMDRNWSVFIHLVDGAGVIAGQRDTYPGVGLLATEDLTPGRRWRSEYVVPVGEAAYAPEDLTVAVGLYDYESGVRMALPDGATSAAVGGVDLRPAAEGGPPNPVQMNFGGEMALVGYAYDARRVAPGETLDVTLYWRGLRAMDANYTVSVQVIDAEGQVAGIYDNWPGDGASPTEGWAPGETVEDTHVVPIAPDAAPGMAEVEVIVYLRGDGPEDIERLKLVTADGRPVDDPVRLSRVRIGP
jgi:4-amino-4-deoxy-L-arabinose transferase-like glycosyltransferase